MTVRIWSSTTLGDYRFDPEKPLEIANAIKVLIEDHALRALKAETAHERAKEFTWERC